MDREEVKTIIYRYCTNNLTPKDLTSLFIGYCVEEHNKSVEDVHKFISILQHCMIPFYDYIETMIRYYRVKFDINLLLVNDKVILVY